MPGTAAERPQRKDAARNHALLLAAAREVFAERGLDASLDDVARHAGLGVGTVYRHFANKQELAEALFAQAIALILADAQRALAFDDPWQGFVAFFEAAATRQATDRGLHQLLVGTYRVERLASVREQLIAPITLLFDRAREAGALRPDVTANDAAVIFSMLGAVYDLSRETAPELWKRYCALLMDGLRATNPAPLPMPALTDEELDVVMLRAKNHPQSGNL